MLAQKKVKLFDGEDGQECYMNNEHDKLDLCKLQDIIDTLKIAKDEMLVPIQYLMGFNEAYKSETSRKGAKKAIKAEVAADYWRKYT